MINKLRISEGDLFKFKVSTGYYGFGQVIISDVIQYIIVFEPKFLADCLLEKAAQSTPLLAGWTMDARFYSGQWEIVGNLPASRKVAFPEYKVEISGQIWVTDLHGKAIRLASRHDERWLKFQTSYSPITFEKAFKAYHGDLPWEARFNELRAQIEAD